MVIKESPGGEVANGDQGEPLLDLVLVEISMEKPMNSQRYW